MSFTLLCSPNIRWLQLLWFPNVEELILDITDEILAQCKELIGDVEETDTQELQARHGWQFVEGRSKELMVSLGTWDVTANDIESLNSRYVRVEYKQLYNT